MQTLIYTSVASQRLTDDALKALLQQARAANASRDVTGMLLYLDPYFIQVLEGEEPIVADLYERIRLDSRHQKVSLIYRKPIKQRLFGDWTMGFNKVSHQALHSLEGFSDFLQRPSAEFFTQSPNRVLDLLHLFKREVLF